MAYLAWFLLRPALCVAVVWCMVVHMAHARDGTMYVKLQALHATEYLYTPNVVAADTDRVERNRVPPLSRELDRAQMRVHAHIDTCSNELVR
jgi:hypothetical protein